MAHSLTRFEPVARLLRGDPLREFDDFFSDMRLPFLRSDSAPRMKLDVKETGQGYKVMADLPGVKREDIKVNIDGAQVSISASTESIQEQEAANMICAERSWGQYYRSFTLPQAVDDTQAHASFHDGVLELDLPKKGGGSAKALKIQ